VSGADRYRELLAAVDELVEWNETVPVIVEGVRDVRALRAMGLRGVIEPVNHGKAVFALCERLGRTHKEAVLRHLDALTDEARAVGAVNTIVREGDRLAGHTTDGVGLLAALAEAVGFHPQGACVVILGAGGAGRAAAFALAAAGARKIAILNRSVERAQALAADVGRAAGSAALAAYSLHATAHGQILDSADIVINATSLGMHTGDPSPLDLALCRPGTVAFDMIYHPPETAFLREARGRGLRTANGLGMLVHQGAAAFALWTGRTAPLEIMRRALAPVETPVETP